MRLTIVLMLLAALFTILCYPLYMYLFKRSDLVRPNYRGEMIPLGIGVIFSDMWLLILIICWIFFDPERIFLIEGFILWGIMLIMTVLGFIDDFRGNTEIKGLRNHFRQMLKGHVTTGAAKAIGGAVVSVVIAWYFSADILQFIINFIVAVLSINYVNLLDLRPGRAGKGFLIYALLIVLFGIGKPQTAYLCIIAVIVLVHLYYDLRARVMMGDAGSNCLGAALGFTAVAVMPTAVKIIMAVLLIAFHWLTEKYSLSEIISRNKLLDAFDKLGRSS